MQVKEAMTAEVVSVGPETPLKEVAQLLVERRISGVPVVDAAGTLLGVISEADFVTKEAGRDDQRHPWLDWIAGGGAEREQRKLVAARVAREAMSAPAITIEPRRPLSDAARSMERHRVNRLPVIDNGRLAGILTRADVVRAYARSDEELRRAAVQALRAVDGLSVGEVRDGIVPLRGTVASRALAETAQQMVRHIDGVVAVDAREVSWLPSPPPELPIL